MKKIVVILISILMILPAESAGVDFSRVDFGKIVESLSEISPELRRGRSFGGSRRRSSSRSRSRFSARSNSNSRSKSNNKSFGGGSRNRRSSSQSMASSPRRPSFGGKRMAPADAKKKYGTPRKSETINRKSATGQNTNYVMHSYGGYGSGLMTGYMMGTTSWMWSMPFHPAFYYSRPVYVTNTDGTVGVYPPTFSFSRIFFILMIIAILIWFFRRSRREKVHYQESYGSFG